jgi:hypothetical protein
MNVEIGTEATLFPEKEFKWISLAVHYIIAGVLTPCAVVL